MLEDARNPWFLQNTRVVTYCLVADEASFGVGPDRADEAFRGAVRFWQEEVADARDAGVSAVTSVVQFVHSLCASGTSLSRYSGDSSVCVIYGDERTRCA